MKQTLASILGGSFTSTTVKRPGEPAIHAVKTEGPLGDMLKNMVPESSTSSLLGSLLPPSHDECSTCCASPCCCEHVEILKKLSSKKYQLILAYIHYGDQLRAMYRDGIYEHFQEHLEEERAQLYQINKKITAMGSDAPCTPGPVPPVPLDNARAIFKTLLPIEEESVSLWSKLFHETEDDVALNGMAQAYATECKGHADDLRRYLRSCE